MFPQILQIVFSIIIIVTHGTQLCINSKSLPIPLHAHQMSVNSTTNTIYIFGGITTNSAMVNNIYKSDFNLNEWIKLNVTTPSTAFWSRINNVVTINNIVYFIGIVDNGSGYQSITPIQMVYAFDINTEKWINTTNIQTPTYLVSLGCIVTNNTHIFIIGGRNDTFVINYLQIYNIIDNSWTKEKISINITGWSEQFCVLVEDNIYVFGGVDISGIYKYNSITKWIYLGSLIGVQNSGVAVYNNVNNAVYIIGGKHPGYGNVIYEYDLDNLQFTNEYAMTNGLDDLTATIIDNKIYIFGGYNDEPLNSKDIQICDILPVITTTASISSTNFPSTTAKTITTLHTQTFNSTTSTQPGFETTYIQSSNGGSLISTNNFTYIIIVLCLFVFIAICGYIHSKIKSNKYLFSFKSIVWFSYHSLDYVTDILFALWLLDKNEITLFVFSLIFLFVPSILSVYHLNRNISFWLNDDHNGMNSKWFREYTRILYCTVFIVGSCQSAIYLFTSKLFGLKIFCLKLNEYQRLKLNNQHLWSSVCCESIPQLIIQIIYICNVYDSSISDITVLTIIFSVSSILMAPFIFVTQKQLIKTARKFTTGSISIQITQNEKQSTSNYMLMDP